MRTSARIAPDVLRFGWPEGVSVTTMEVVEGEDLDGSSGVRAEDCV